MGLSENRGNRRRQAASRMRQCRARRRNGLHVVRVAYPDALPLALCDAGFLAAWDSEDRAAVARAIERVLRAMCAGGGYSVTGSDADTV